MLCYVLQNFKYNTPFLVKTIRYHNLTRLLNVRFFNLLLLLITSSSYAINRITNLTYLYNTQFIKPLWFFFKKFVIKPTGLYFSNLSFSAVAATLTHLINLKNYKPLHKTVTNNAVFYSKPICIINFSFHKKVYNTIIVYLIWFLPNLYNPTTTSFKLNYSFIFVKDLLMYYDWTTNYYIKLLNV